ncbi:MAG TPA: bifunctional nuclease family protein [Candidatus Hydrogenedentes bacterium]|nr:bifunctional nuclease family protein [Candidatus Hydrogenedentota bacterium]
MLEVEILGVSDGPQHPVVLLRHEDRILPIVVGIPEAHAIQIGVLDEKLGRPMTHDLICNILAGFNAEVESLTIYKLENDTFFAHLNVHQLSEEGDLEQVFRIDSRPSDGIAVAVRQKCPIYVAEEVMDSAAHDVDIPDDDESGEFGTWGG